MSILRIGHKLQRSELLIKRLGTDILKAVFTPVETQTATSAFAGKYCLFFVGTFEGKSYYIFGHFANYCSQLQLCTVPQSTQGIPVAFRGCFSKLL